MSCNGADCTQSHKIAPLTRGKSVSALEATRCHRTLDGVSANRPGEPAATDGVALSFALRKVVKILINSN
jgi:hypothetical protein